jgi:methyl-accepting chemotaxis protein
VHVLVLALGLQVGAGAAFALAVPIAAYGLGLGAIVLVTLAASLLMRSPPPQEQAGDDSQRIRAALDACRTNVMVADESYNITYLNRSLDRMLRAAESDLRQVLPNFDSKKLIGANMDVFHKHPAHQRRALDSLTGSHEANITVGTLRFNLLATAIVDAAGKRTGTVIEWKNETDEKQIESEVEAVIQAAAAGDFSRRIPLQGKAGFFLNLAGAMNSLCENVATTMKEFSTVLGALADGDLTRRVTGDYQGIFATLKDDANAMSDRIAATISEIKTAADEVSNAAAEISTATTNLSQRTEEQAASLEETSASMEQMAATVKKNAESAQQANQFANGTQEVAGRGGNVVAEAVGAMARIEESSRKIADIIGVIDEIARQTNLLALNAAVEAARAGEAGRGFAVVASEVRSLAQRSSQAAKDIKDLITNSSGQVKEGVELVNRAGGSLTEIVDSIKKVAEIVSAIATASGEQSTGIEQVNIALSQMDEATQQNSALVEENAATAKTLAHQAAAMNERVSIFKLGEASSAGDVAPPSVVPLRRPAANGAQAQAAPPRRRPDAAPRRPAMAAGGPVGRMQAAAAVQTDADWQEF